MAEQAIDENDKVKEVPVDQIDHPNKSVAKIEEDENTPLTPQKRERWLEIKAQMLSNTLTQVELYAEAVEGKMYREEESCGAYVDEAGKFHGGTKKLFCEMLGYTEPSMDRLLNRREVNLLLSKNELPPIEGAGSLMAALEFKGWKESRVVEVVKALVDCKQEVTVTNIRDHVQGVNWHVTDDYNVIKVTDREKPNLEAKVPGGITVKKGSLLEDAHGKTEVKYPGFGFFKTQKEANKVAQLAQEGKEKSPVQRYQEQKEKDAEKRAAQRRAADIEGLAELARQAVNEGSDEKFYPIQGKAGKTWYIVDLEHGVVLDYEFDDEDSAVEQANNLTNGGQTSDESQNEYQGDGDYDEQETKPKVSYPTPDY